VLEVIYLVFNEGYAATAGDDWLRPALCEEALRLGRILAGLMPGEPVLLLEQDRARWDRVLVGRGLAALARAEELGGARGPYALQAAIAACHARATSVEATDWPRIVALYDALAQVAPSPVVELNRAVAVSMASGPDVGLAAVDALADDRALQNYHLLPSVRGELLRRLERHAEARAEFERAAGMTRNARERELLLAKARDCAA
jgi:predicted RNA polymerase sigma factor